MKNLLVPENQGFTHHRPSILASSPTSTSTKKEEAAAAESGEHDDGGGIIDGTVGEWRPWSDITTPLLDELLPRVSLPGRILLSSVCRSWHSFFLDDHPALLYRRLRFPWLMRPAVDEHLSIRDFYSLCDGRYYTFHLDNITRSRCFAASHGWLLFFRYHCEQFQGSLVNPLSKAHVDLPDCSVRIARAALSAAPTEPGCIMLALSRVRTGTWNICYCPLQEKSKSWHFQPAQFTLKSNIAVMGRKFYFLCQEGLAEMNYSQNGHPLKWRKLNDGVLRELDHAPPRNKLPYEFGSNYNWLVESNRNLLVVTLFRQERAKFVAYVHKADFENKIWTKVENLHGWSLFLSKEACFSLTSVNGSDDDDGRVYVSDRDNYSYTGQLWQEYTLWRESLDQLLSHYKVVGTEGKYSSYVEQPLWLMPSI